MFIEDSKQSRNKKAGVQGFEPRLSGSEPLALTITLYPSDMISLF